MPKKLVILKHGGGELANQLWNYASIYAYGLETGASVRNPSFFEYHYFFRFLKNESVITKLTTRIFFSTPRRRSHVLNRIQRSKYAVRAEITELFNSKRVYSSENSLNQATYLPPSADLPARLEGQSKIYLSGWLFRNPKGLAKFGEQLRRAFLPEERIVARIDGIMTPLRARYERVVGIHIRQSDYAGFKDGRFILSQDRVRAIINEYIREYGIDATKTLFLIASDGPIDQSKFNGLNIYVSKENSVVDLFLLARTDIILGSDSSFGAFAAWHADIPHVIFKNDRIDWEYYKEKKAFFENKYSDLARY